MSWYRRGIGAGGSIERDNRQLPVEESTTSLLIKVFLFAGVVVAITELLKLP